MSTLSTERYVIFNGDCRTVLSDLPDASIDAVVTDPPYELGFMGKKWDASGVAYDPETWKAVLRVLKPGGHLLAFGATRTYHRMTVAIEDAGFEIRDSLHWMYGTGFPKSLNLGDGRGTALKPSHEPIVMARRPLAGTVAQNVAQHGTGALNIDACRIASADAHTTGRKNSGGKGNGGVYGDSVTYDSEASPLGRWPANVLLDEDAAAELDAQSGVRKSGAWDGKRNEPKTKNTFGEFALADERPREASEGGASRFFYVAKPTRKERDAGCHALPAKFGGEATDREEGSAGLSSPRAGAGRTGGARNFHPTVKPVALMRYLVRLITPPGGVVLDPFAGSGTTGMAALYEGFDFVGVEFSEEYLPILKARLEHAEKEAA